MNKAVCVECFRLHDTGWDSVTDLRWDLHKIACPLSIKRGPGGSPRFYRVKRWKGTEPPKWCVMKLEHLVLQQDRSWSKKCAFTVVC